MHKLIALLTVLILTSACGMAPARSARTDNRGASITLAPTYTRLPTRTATRVPTVTRTPEPTATLPPTATETPTPDASPTPIPTATQAVLTETTGAVVIVNIAYNGSGGKEPDEYVEIRNDGDQPVAIAGWRLQDKAEHAFRFPEFALEPGQSCRIYTNQVHTDTCGFSFRNDETAVWNNGGDCAYLLDATGVEVAKYCY